MKNRENTKKRDQNDLNPLRYEENVHYYIPDLSGIPPSLERLSKLSVTERNELVMGIIHSKLSILLEKSSQSEINEIDGIDDENFKLIKEISGLLNKKRTLEGSEFHIFIVLLLSKLAILLLNSSQLGIDKENIRLINEMRMLANKLVMLEDRPPEKFQKFPKKSK